MNTSYLMRHVSYGLHTIVKSWPHPICPDTIPEIFCGRQDFQDTFLTAGDLCQALDTWKKTDVKCTLCQGHFKKKGF